VYVYTDRSSKVQQVHVLRELSQRSRFSTRTSRTFEVPVGVTKPTPRYRVVHDVQVQVGCNSTGVDYLVLYFFTFEHLHVQSSTSTSV
jgi:hypothetical protein